LAKAEKNRKITITITIRGRVIIERSHQLPCRSLCYPFFFLSFFFLKVLSFLFASFFGQKKIKDVLSRRRPKEKRGTDRVAVWYDKQGGKNLLPTSLVHGVQDSQLDNSSESDWELV